jgi:hypothetical protein
MDSVAIRMTRNEIENTAIDKLLAREDQYPLISKILGDGRLSVIGEKPAACPWPCPQRQCGPDCHPGFPFRVPLRFEAAKPTLDIAMAAMRWHGNALENAALGQLVSRVDAKLLHVRLRETLDALRALPDK